MKKILLLFVLLIFLVTPVSAIADDAYTTNLLHMNGTSGSTVFTDEALASTWTARGTIEINTSVKILGSGSGWFKGTGDLTRFYGPSDTYLDWGTGDWTMEWRMNTPDYSGQISIFQQAQSYENADNYFSVVISNGLVYLFYVTGATSRAFYSFPYPSLPVNQWNTFAIQRNGSAYEAFVNGTKITTTTYTAFNGNLNPPDGDFNIGNVSIAFGGPVKYVGNFDEWRISKGIARYGAPGYTPSTTEFGASTTDTTPPASITNLGNTTANCDNITWTWTNPANADYGYLYTKKNNVFEANLSNVTASVLWSGLTESTAYTFDSKTYDLSGNGNLSWVNKTVTLPACPIPPAPNASFTQNQTSGIYPLAVQFTDTSINSPTSWVWSVYPTGTTIFSNSSSQNLIYLFSTGGNFTVSLTATNNYGNNTNSSYITIYNQTLASFTASNTTGNNPLIVHFTDTSINTTPTASYYWMFGDGNSSSQQNPTFTYNILGTFSVNHSASNGYSISWNNQTNYIIVSSISTPLVNFTGSPLSGSLPLVVNFTDQSTNTTDPGAGISSWNWNFGDGSTSSLQNPGHQYITNGFFTVSLTAANIGGPSTLTKTNYINITGILLPVHLYYWERIS